MNDTPDTDFKTTQPVLFAAGAAKLKANGVYSKAWNNYFDAIDTAPLVQVPAFHHQLLEFFVSLIVTNLQDDGWRRHDAVKLACDEIFRRTLTGESRRVVIRSSASGMFTLSYSFEDMVRFARWYDQADNLVSTCFDASGVDFDRGDDGFGDLCDAIPLLGLEFLRTLDPKKKKNLPFQDSDGLESFVRARTARWDEPGEKRLAELILFGESYIEMRLGEMAKRRMLSKIVAEMSDAKAVGYEIDFD